MLTDDGPLAVEIPRDRHGTFESQLIPKHARRLAGFDDKVLALYGRGLTVRDIQKFLEEIYAIAVSPALISEVTDAVVAAVTAWQSRPLEPMYPVVFFDALRVKIRDESVVRSTAVYLALAILRDGTLGIWIEHTEGAKFWLKVFNDLKTRGCHDILIAVTDGLEGMARPRYAPSTRPRRPRRPAPPWTPLRPARGASAFPPSSKPGVRREPRSFRSSRFPQTCSVHARVRKIIKTRGHFPTDEAATKLIWLALRNITRAWSHKAGRHWRATIEQFAILYEDRFLKGPASPRRMSGALFVFRSSFFVNHSSLGSGVHLYSFFDLRFSF